MRRPPFAASGFTVLADDGDTATGRINEGKTPMEIEVGAVREILAQHGRLSVDVNNLDADSDLYAYGLTSLATVGIMLALEDRFDVEFPESMLSRKTFKSVSAITQAVISLPVESAM